MHRTCIGRPRLHKSRYGYVMILWWYTGFYGRPAANSGTDRVAAAARISGRQQQPQQSTTVYYSTTVCNSMHPSSTVDASRSATCCAACNGGAHHSGHLAITSSNAPALIRFSIHYCLFGVSTLWWIARVPIDMCPQVLGGSQPTRRKWQGRE